MGAQVGEVGSVGFGLPVDQGGLGVGVGVLNAVFDAVDADEEEAAQDNEEDHQAERVAARAVLDWAVFVLLAVRAEVRLPLLYVLVVVEAHKLVILML